MDWSSDVCSADLCAVGALRRVVADGFCGRVGAGATQRTGCGLVQMPWRRRRAQLSVGALCRTGATALAARGPPGAGAAHDTETLAKTGTAPWRDRECQYGEISGVAVDLKQ